MAARAGVRAEGSLPGGAAGGSVTLARDRSRLISSSRSRIEDSICAKWLEWGASLGPYEIGALRGRHRTFRARIDSLLAEHELLLMPTAPLGRLNAGADHSQTRARMLRYTTPFSLSGSPVISIPCETGGMQLAAAHGRDVALLEFAAKLGAAMKR